MRVLSICLLLAVAAPAFAQEASPRIDWSKPVIGVDGNILQIPDESAPRAVEVYTIDDLTAAGSPSVEEFLKSPRPPAQPCDLQKQGAEVRCTLPQQKPLPATSGDPLATYSPEMREKLRRYLPEKKLESQ